MHSRPDQPLHAHVGDKVGVRGHHKPTRSVTGRWVGARVMGSWGAAATRVVPADAPVVHQLLQRYETHASLAMPANPSCLSDT